MNILCKGLLMASIGDYLCPFTMVMFMNVDNLGGSAPPEKYLLDPNFLRVKFEVRPPRDAKSQKGHFSPEKWPFPFGAHRCAVKFTADSHSEDGAFRVSLPFQCRSYFRYSLLHNLMESSFQHLAGE